MKFLHKKSVWFILGTDNSPYLSNETMYDSWECQPIYQTRCTNRELSSTGVDGNMTEFIIIAVI